MNCEQKNSTHIFCEMPNFGLKQIEAPLEDYKLGGTGDRKVGVSISSYSHSLSTLLEIGLHRPKQKPPKIGPVKLDF